jgi:ABC-type transport system substrate-binding protein
MKTRKFENGLAVLGALVVMLGVTAAAGSALAADSDQVTSTAVAVHEAGDNTVVDADKANTETAERAVRALELSTLIELDIAITDRTSMLVADGR